MSESNAALAERYRRNDETAFAQLVQRHQKLVFTVCLRILGHRQDAEDVTQETFSRMARYLNRWDQRRPLEPWLVTIAGNRCRTFLARRRPHQTLLGVSEPSSDLTDQQIAADSLREEIELAMRELPAQLRHAFEMFHRQGMSYDEIAAELDCPVGTVKTWVHRARSRLISQLRDREVVLERPPATEIAAREVRR